MSTGDKREIQINHRHDQILITQIIHPEVVGASVNDSLVSLGEVSNDQRGS